MKIALLTPTFYPYSGIDRMVEFHAKRFIEQGHTVCVFALDAAAQSSAIPIEVLGMPRGLTAQRMYRLLFFFDIPKIVKAVRQLKDFPAVYSYFYPMNILALLARRLYRARFVYYNPGLPPPETFQTLFQKVYIMLFRILSNWTAKKADSVISISKYLAEIFLKETGKASTVEYLSIDRSRFNSAVDRTRVRERLKLGSRPVMLYVGRLSPHKGIDLLLKSLRLVQHELPTATLLLVGKPTFPQYAKRLQRRAPSSVIFLGDVDDHELPSYYGACDVYTTTTLWEGFDLPLVEAQACGQPVIAFDLGPHRELIDSHGVLVPPRDVRAFASAVVSMLQKKKP